MLPWEQDKLALQAGMNLACKDNLDLCRTFTNLHLHIREKSNVQNNWGLMHGILRTWQKPWLGVNGLSVELPGSLAPPANLV